MSLNRRKDEDILNDLHSAEGRLNSSEIIDLKTELETNEMKEKIHRANMENETAEVDKEQSTKMEELKKALGGREKIDAVELQNICKEPILGGSNMQVIPFDKLETLLGTNNLLEGTKTEAYQKLIEKGFILGQGEPRIYNGTIGIFVGSEEREPGFRHKRVKENSDFRNTIVEYEKQPETTLKDGIRLFDIDELEKIQSKK